LKLTVICEEKPEADMSWNEIWTNIVREEIEDGARQESSEGDWSEPQKPPILQNSATRQLKAPAQKENEMGKFKRMFLKAQRTGLLIGLVAIVVMPLISNVYVRVGILAYEMGLMIRLFIVFQDSIVQKLETLITHVAALGSPSGRIPKFADFAACQALIEAECKDFLSKGQDLTLDLQVVAAAFSWPFFKERLQDWSRQFPNQQIYFNIALVCSDTLTSWGAVCWSRRVEATVSEIEVFIASNDQPNLVLSIYRYDRIPDEHGILINNAVLYRGRTEWMRVQDDSFELRIGTRPYLRFGVETPDGNDQISTFRSWVRQARIRDLQLKLSEPDKSTEVLPIITPVNFRRSRRSGRRGSH
jgi:hypothetical protein